MKIGMVSYINTIPLLSHDFTDINSTFMYDHPSIINRHLQEGVCDIALISAESFLQHQEMYQWIPNLGIGATLEVMSVCLYTKRPISQLQSIHIPNTSETSNQLLKILCEKSWNIFPQYVLFNATTGILPLEQEAFLLIGDISLQHQEISGFTRIDLAKEWYAYTQLPFIFALFATKKETYKEKYALIQEFIRRCQPDTDHLPKYVEEAKKKVPIPEKTLSRYFQTIDYELTKEHHQGLLQFEKLRNDILHKT